MIADTITELGPWSWMVLGFVLLALEVVVPGFFLVWIGIAAILTGALSIQLWEATYWTWQAQLVVFLTLSLASAYIGSRILRDRQGDSDQPLLNKRGEQLVGRMAVLSEAIEGGRGRARIGDTTWTIVGPDLPEGSRVRVAGIVDGTLSVEPAEEPIRPPRP